MSVAPKTLARALLTDVFGTVVNWRYSVTRCLEEHCSRALESGALEPNPSLRTTATACDWSAVAQSWRVKYYDFTRTYQPADSAAGFVTMDQFFRSSLCELMDEYSVSGLWQADEITRISQIWHRLQPWPDSAPGLAALASQGFVTSTLGNGNRALLTDLTQFGRLPYSRILGAEDFGAYKPNPAVYNGAARELGLPNEQCALIAAHLRDLAAARDLGYRTIYIDRPQEESADAMKEAKAAGWVDIWIEQGEGGFEELARRLAARREESSAR